MILKIYILILCYFSLGAALTLLNSFNRDAIEKKRFWLKYMIYFIIINLVFVSIAFNPIYFQFVSIFIITVGYFELIILFVSSGFRLKLFFITSIFIYSIISLGFYFYASVKIELLLYTFLVISVFDSFSQISGQLFGKRRIFPNTSPNKTLEGFVGGVLFALFTSILLTDYLNVSYQISLIYGVGIILSSLLGDISASFFKRKYKVKDFSNLLPGHGGILDRFDSLIAGGSFMYLVTLFSF